MRYILHVCSLFIFSLFPALAHAQIDDLVHVRLDVQLAAVVTSGKTSTHSFVASSPAREYNGIILSGSASGDFRQGFVRFREGSGWTDWQPLVYLSTSTSELFLAGYRGMIYRPGDAFELRFDTPAGETIEIKEAGVFDNRLDEDGFASDKTSRPLPSQDAGAVILPPKLITRSAWGAEPFIGNPVPLSGTSYQRMTFHHAACCGAFTYEEGLMQLKSIQTFHQEVRGWSDIGYHFVFDQSGRLYQGRPFLDNRTSLDVAPVLALGAHVGGANTGNIGVSVLGCYHPSEGAGCTDVMSPALQDSVVAFYAYLSERYGVNTNNLLGHRDQSATSCPGDNNYALLPELRTEIDRFIQTGGLPRIETFFLSENFPNPFQTSTTIRYHLDQEGVVRLKVYDAAGRLISTLVDAFQEADRWYTVDFGPGNLANGIYYYRLHVEGFSDIVFDDTKAMVLMRQ